MKKAVVGFETNAFHLPLIEQTVSSDPPIVLFRESRAAKTGKGGINQN